ncbi:MULTISPECIES: hypothetical protein [unclassified Streptomyces]|uniref:Aminoglycoside phosphotransferase domain-containing protein n=1 Tax=Streptomyces sp. NBC_00060 TaxID=2975636 RepID=A0AAU2GQP3_9ACTN
MTPTTADGRLWPVCVAPSLPRPGCADLHRLRSTTVDSTDRAHLIDWSWAAVGPPWVDGALWAMRLISDGGHSPEQARHQAQRIPAFAAASPQAAHLLADAEARRWQDLNDDGVPGVESVTEGSRLWADFWASAQG